MHSATTSTFALYPDPRGRLHRHRQPAASPGRPRSRAGIRRSCQLPPSTLPAAGQSSAAGQRAWHHPDGRPPAAPAGRPYPVAAPGDRRPQAPQNHRPAPRGTSHGAGLRHAPGLPGRPGGDPAMAKHQHRQRAWRPPGHRAGPAGPAPAPPPARDHPARRAIQRQTECWAAKRQARLAELGFADVEGYLRVRRVEHCWSRRRMLTELRVAPAWLKDQLQRVGIP
jgi:hypothetical protein